MTTTNPYADTAREHARQDNGQFGTQPLAEVTGVELTTPSPRTVGSYADDVNRLWDQWELTDTHDPEFCDAILVLGGHIRAASEEDRPGYDILAMRVDLLDEDPTEPDLAFDALFEMRRITRESNMTVVENGNGGHTRLADGRPGVTCDSCGNGYATQKVLDSHACEEGDYPRLPDGSIDVPAAIEAGIIQGFTATPFDEPKMVSFHGHWEGNTIVVESVFEGEVEDERPDTGYWSEGLWASSATGSSDADVAASMLDEYEQSNSIRIAVNDDDYTPDEDDELEEDEG